MSSRYPEYSDYGLGYQMNHDIRDIGDYDSLEYEEEEIEYE